MKNVIAIMFMLVFLSPCVFATPPKNVILFIGDGMGFQQVYAAECYAGKPMFFGSFPYQGQVTTRSADNSVTDSAASGSAIATGFKVNNGVISMAFPGDGSELQTLLEYYQLAGKKVGLVTTTYLTHATPAVFGAHEASRSNYSAIGQDMLNRSRPNVLLGGGENGISPAGATSAGYNVVTDLAGFSATVTNSSYTSSFAGLFGNGYMDYKYDYLSEPYPYPTLAEMTAAAIAALGDDSDGFFLMVEGGLIDQACHSNDIARCVFEVLDFNSAVVTAYNAYSANADTLILVTADHETGGLTVLTDNGDGVFPDVHWSSTNHTAANVPVYAWGKNSLLASGALDNTQIRSICTRDDKATNPYPSVGQTDVPTQVTLSWTAGVGATQHQVVVWTTDPAQTVVNTNTTATQYALTCEAGKTYFWKVNEVDTGITGDTWSFTTQQVQVTLIPAGATWKYNDTNTDFYSQGWPSVDDSQWASGAAPLGYGDSHIITTLTQGSPRYPTYYFRKSFELTQAYQSVTLKVMRDDGCVVYLNGTEVARTGMPDGFIAHTTWATNISGNADETTYHEFNLNPALLTTGTNILAVDVHQCNDGSSDLGFGLILSGVACPALEAHDDSALTKEDIPIVIDVLSNDSNPKGYSLMVVSVTQPGHGSATINVDETITYAPAPNFSGTDTFTYTIEDGHSNSDSAMVTITVDNTDNDFPTAVDDAVSTDEGVAITIDVLINDTDPDNDILSISEVTQPGNGTAVIEGRMVVYTPNPSFTGTDTFTYTAQDTAGGFASAVVAVLVSAVNDPPIAYDDAVSTQEDTATAIDVLGNDTDPENNALTVTSITQPSYGTTAINAEGTVSYTPNPNFNGTDAFTYTVGDGLLDSGAAVVTITVDPVNDAPAAANDQAQTIASIGVCIAVLANDTDIEGDALTAVLLTAPGHGTVRLDTADQTITYTPAPGFLGQDSFTYAASDGYLASTAASVTITVSEPILFSDDFESGTFSSVWTASSQATIDAASAQTGSYGVLMKKTSTLTLNLSGLNLIQYDNVKLTYGRRTAGLAGSEYLTVTCDGVLLEQVNQINAYSTSPELNLPAGATTIQFRINGNAGNDLAMIDNIRIVADTPTIPNLSPIVVDDEAAVQEDTAVIVYVLANDSDPDGDSLMVTGAADPANGTVVVSGDNTITYTPDGNYYGSDSFTYTVSDGKGGTDTAAVTITVNAVNDSPVAVADSYATTENTVLMITAPGVLGNDGDADGDTLNASLISGTPHGTIVLNADGSFTYTPENNYNGPDGFTYTASDGSLTSIVTTVTITVNYVNDSPNAVDDTALTDEDTPVNVAVLSNDSDPDGDSLTVQDVTQGTNGTVSFDSGSVTYTPDEEFNGTDSFTYTVSDGNGGTDTAAVTITVNAVNDSPVAAADSFVTTENTVLTIAAAAGVLINDTDVDMDSLSASLIDGTTHGTIVLNADGSFTYTPTANYAGSDSFTYTASDGSLSSTVTIVTITVNFVNDSPNAVDDTAVTDEDTPVNVAVLSNDTDPDGDILVITGVVNPANGTVVVNGDNTITYTPDGGYYGTDSFTYTVSDGKGGTATGTVTVTVTEASSTPDMYIADIAMQKFTAGKNVYATATVLVLDKSGNPVVGATVYGDWSGSVSGSISGITDGSGLVVLRSGNVKKGGTFTFTVTDVVLDGYAYNPELSETSDSI